jgi:Zn-dependent protease with chaperone function
MVLRMHGARQVDRAQAPEFYDMIAELAKRADLPMPKVYIMDNPQPNAFATGSQSGECRGRGDHRPASEPVARRDRGRDGA